MPLNLLFNTEDASPAALLDNFLSAVALTDNKNLIRGDRNLAIQLRPVVPSLTSSRPWDDDLANGDTFQVAIGNPDSGPVSGTFPLSLGGSSMALPLDAETIEEAITAAHGGSYGPAQVTLVSDGVYQVAWLNNGAVPQLDSSGSNNLSPDSVVNTIVDQAGSGATKAVQFIVLRQSPVAYCQPATPLPAAAVAAQIRQAGSGSVNKIYAISLTAGTYGGNFSVSLTSKQGNTQALGLGTGDMDADTFAALLATHTDLTVADVSVTRQNDVFAVEFIGTQGLSNVPVIAVGNLDLLAPLGVSGIIQLNTVSLYRAFWMTGADTLDFTLSVRRARTSGEDAEIFQHTVTLRRNIIDVATMASVSFPTYALSTVPGKYRIKADGTFQLWNSDQNLFFAVGVSGSAGNELLGVGNTGEV